VFQFYQKGEIHVNEYGTSADAAIGEPVLPMAGRIGARNAALSGSAPRMSAVSIVTSDWANPSTVSFDKMDS
jgi:hypothetical protein